MKLATSKILKGIGLIFLIGPFAFLLTDLFTQKANPADAANEGVIQL